MVVLGISVDGEAANKAFRDGHGLEFDLLCDVDRRMSLAYGALESASAASAARITYVVGPDTKIATVYAHVKAGTHAQQVLQDLG